MNTSTLFFRTLKCPRIMPEHSSEWVGRVITKGTASPEEVAAVVAEQTRQTVSDVIYTTTKTGEAVRTLLRSGRNVSLDWVAFQIVLTGSFDNVDSNFDPKNNSLAVRASSRRFIKDCLDGIVPRNVTNGLRSVIQSIVDSAAQAEGVITTTTVYVAGLNILVDDNPDEGVWLVADDGTVAATPTITANNASSMDLSFGELPPDGDYTLVVKARSGASTDYAPAVARRCVAVRRAS